MESPGVASRSRRACEGRGVVVMTSFGSSSPSLSLGASRNAIRRFASVASG